LGLVHLDLNDQNSASEEQRLLESLGHHDCAALLLDEIQRQAWRLTRVPNKEQDGNTDGRSTAEKHLSRNDQGFSVIGLLIVVSIITIVIGFALMQVTRARQVMARQYAARLFTSHLEKARLESLRRHPMTSDQMAQVSAVNASFYTVVIDANGDGTLEAPLVVSLPNDSGLQFNTPFPRTVYFKSESRS